MATNKITKEEVEKIALLSNLMLSEEDVELFASLFTDTLKYMDELNELDTSDTPEAYHVTGLTNVFQKDEDPSTTLSQAEALRNANEARDNHFVTKAVFDR